MSCGAILNLASNASATNRRTHYFPDINSKFSTTRRRIMYPLLQKVNAFSRIGNKNHELSSTIKRRRWRCCLSPDAATSLDLPLLPFNTSEVLVPSESKTLHLYEPRYLTLLEESLLRKQKLFVHFVLDPIIICGSENEASFEASYGCLVIIENVEHLGVGALVSVRGIGRIKIVKFLQDLVLDNASKLTSKVSAVKEALYNLNSLEIKLKAPKEAFLQTRIANSLTWAEKEPSLECDRAFIPSLAERVSFSAFQPISGSTQSEMLKMLQLKLRAMDLKDTIQRLDESLQLVNENISMVAAKLAIQSLEMQ